MSPITGRPTPGVDEVWAHVAAERRSLADFLATLAPADWEVPSLCAGWAVRDVVAHVVWGPGQSSAAAMSSFVRAGFRLNRAVADTARRWGRREPARMVAHLREIAEDRRHSPLISGTHVLADVVCHGLDIRRPLGRPCAVPREPFRLTAALMVRTTWPLDTVFARSPRRTVAGLRLVAEDLDWTLGEGPEVRGSAEALLLAMTGRPVGPAELTGTGASTLYDRMPQQPPVRDVTSGGHAGHRTAPDDAAWRSWWPRSGGSVRG